MSRRTPGAGEAPAGEKGEAAGGSRRWAFGLLVALILASGLVQRVVPGWPIVFQDEGIALLGNDSYYHLRHVRFAVEQFPTIQRWDPGTHYPEGQRSVSAGLFDLTLAAVTRIAPIGPEAVLAVAPLVFGLLALLLVVRIGGRAEPVLGLLAGFFLVVYPGDLLLRTSVGFGDHHGAEVVLILWTLLALSRCIEKRGSWTSAGGAGLPLVVLIFTWRGAPLVLALLLVSLLAIGLWRVVSGPGVPIVASVGERVGVVALLATAGIGMMVPSWVLDPEYFPWVLAGLAALIGGGAALRVMVRVRREGRVPPWALLLASGAVLVAGWLLVRRFPGSEKGFDLLFQARTGAVAEHRAVTWRALVRAFGPLVFVALASPLAIVVLADDSEDRERNGLWVVFSLFFLVVWWRTRDHGYAVSPLMALTAALAVAAVPWRGAFRRPWARSLAIGALVLAYLSPIWPLSLARAPWVSGERVERLARTGTGWPSALRFLREQTPEPTLPVDARVPPWKGDLQYPEGTYGVWAPWDFGNLVAAEARRPVVWSQGVTGRKIEWIFLEDEAAAARDLQSGCHGPEEVRYVVLDSETLSEHLFTHLRLAGISPSKFLSTVDLPGSPRSLPALSERFERTLAARLFFHGGKDLGRFRLVHETPEKALVAHRIRHGRSGEPTGMRLSLVSLPLSSGSSPLREIPHATGLVPVEGVGDLYRGRITSSVKVFEVVPGARLVVRGAPGVSVTAALELQSASKGRRWTYRREGEIGEDGELELVVSYPTEPGLGFEVEALGSYRVTVGRSATARSFSVDVSEEQVRNGDSVALLRTFR